MDAETLAAALPNAELRILGDTGHVPSVTRPTRVAEVIAAFLAAH